MEFILIATLTQSAVAASLLWRYNKKGRAERFLWLFLAMMALHMVIKFAFLEVMKDEILYEYFSTPFSLGYPPILFFYIQTIRLGQAPPLKTQFLHLIPLIIFSIIYLSLGFYIYQTHDYTWVYDYKKTTRYATVISNFIYIPIIIKILNREKNRFSQFRGLILPMYAWLLLMGPFLVFNALSDGDRHPAITFIAGSLLLYFMVSILINIVKSFMVSLEQKASQSENKANTLEERLSELENQMKTLEEKVETTTSKYEKSGLTETQAQQYITALQRLMTVEKLYLNADLSLADLASRLNTSKHHITEVLNVQLKKNFFLFVNEYRTREAQSKIANGEAENLFMLAHSCGFNSKTTFIKYFKKIVGMTPSQYRKSLYSNQNKSKPKQETLS